MSIIYRDDNYNRGDTSNEYVPLSLNLLHKKDYTELTESMKGLPIGDQIKIYQDIYDSEIPFDNYFWNRFPSNNMKRNSPCPIHDESVDGESFAIDTVRNMWQCFGKCKMVGRVTQFELEYGRKSDPKLTRLGALKRLHKKYPILPKPIIQEQNIFLSTLDGSTNIGFELNVKQGKEIILNERTEDVSSKILQAILIEKNFSKK